MNPRVTQAHFDARRQEILAAAFRCFSERGFHKTTMQEIADDAGLSAGALYRYFDGKEGLIEALAAEAGEQRSETLSALELADGAGGLADVIVQMLGRLGDEAAEVSIRLDVRLWAEALDHPQLREAALAAFSSLHGPIADYVQAETTAGRIRADIDPEAVGRIVVSLLTGLELQRACEPDLDLDAYRAAVRAAVAGLAPSAS